MTGTIIEYLLDTNIVSQLVRHPAGSLVKRIAQVGTSRIAISIIVAGELWFGARRHGGDRLRNDLAQVIGGLTVLPLEEPAEHYFAEVRDALAIAGMPIGPNDLWIAAHALALDVTLVTANEREFRRVPGLKVENWRV